CRRRVTNEEGSSTPQSVTNKKQKAEETPQSLANKKLRTEAHNFSEVNNFYTAQLQEVGLLRNTLDKIANAIIFNAQAKLVSYLPPAERETKARSLLNGNQAKTIGAGPKSIQAKR